MPTSKSAKKRLRQDNDRRERNRSIKSAVRTQMKKVRTAVAEGDAERANSEFRLAQEKLDRAAAKNLIHANTAARLKSRLNSHILSGGKSDKAEAKPKPKRKWSLRRRKKSK